MRRRSDRALRVWRPASRPVQPRHKALSAKMRVTGEHLQGLVARDGFDFHDVEVGLLEETGGCLVAKVMETQVLYASAMARIDHCR